MKTDNILLIEVKESHIENINIPFVLYGRVAQKRGVKMRSLFALLNDQRKQMADTYRRIDGMFHENYKTESDKQQNDD